MQILPRLDAAVIAHDWVPCMQKRQQELKTWLQKSVDDADPETFAKALDKVPVTAGSIVLADILQDLRNIIDESQDIAKAYYKLFEVAKDLQEKDLHKKVEELDDAHVQQSEAIFALARHVSIHNEKCAQYERELEESRDKATQSIDILSQFIHQNLEEAMQNAPQEKIEEIVHVLVEMKSDTKYSSTHVRSELYENLKQVLEKSNDERHGFQDICKQQMKTIQGQSKDLDQYIARMARVISIVQDKDRENQKLRQELAEVREQNHSLAKATETATQLACHKEQEYSLVSDGGNAVLQRSLVNEIWKRDAEITNLRRKLEKAYTRETDVQSRMRLLQCSQSDQADKQPSRFKRLLVGQQKSSPSIPTLNSMQNLSHSVYTPFQKEKLNSTQPTSPTKSGRSSPSFGAFCETVTKMDHPELSLAHKTHHFEGSPPSNPARVRRTVHYPTDEIESAISSRFHQMPANIRSSASTPRPQAPKSSSTLDYEDMADYHLGRPRFNSDPGISEVSTVSERSDHSEEDRQPLVNRSRVLSGITEVTEDGSSFKRRGSSVDSNDKRIYLDNLHAARALGGLQIG